jgi:hypothetical protein
VSGSHSLYRYDATMQATIATRTVWSDGHPRGSERPGLPVREGPITRRDGHIDLTPRSSLTKAGDIDAYTATITYATRGPLRMSEPVTEPLTVSSRRLAVTSTLIEGELPQGVVLEERLVGLSTRSSRARSRCAPWC